MKREDIALFNRGTHNRSLKEIVAMRDILSEKTFFLRQCIREAVSRLLMDTSEHNPLVVDIALNVEGGPGMSCLENPRVTRIWQDPAEGIIWVTLDNSVMDFEESLRTDEQVQVLQYLEGALPEKDAGLIVYPMDALRGISDEKMARLRLEPGCFNPADPYFHYDLNSGLLESLTDLEIAHYNDGLSEDQQLVMATPEQVFDLKWGGPHPYRLEDKDFAEYIEDLFTLYEQTGFADDFQTAYSDRAPRNGETFEVVRRATARDGVEEEQMPMWLIKFDDDTTTLAFPEEISVLERNKNKR